MASLQLGQLELRLSVQFRRHIRISPIYWY